MPCSHTARAGRIPAQCTPKEPRCRQCERSQVCIRSGKSSGKKMELQLANTAAQTSSVPVLPSPSVWRSQMFSIFIEAYFPTLRGGVTPSGWLLKFPKAQDSSMLFPLALDVLCLSHLGKVDPQMKKPAFSAYAKMVATLRRSLQLSDQKFSTIDHRMVAASMIALALLDAPDKSTQADWMTHWDAAYRFASTRGPSYFDVQDPLTEALLRELFQGSLFLGLARREGLPTPHAGWMNSCLFGQARGSKECGLRNLYPDDVQMPNVLALADQLIEDPSNAVLLGKYLTAVTEAKASIRSSISATLGAGPPKRIYSSDGEAFDPEIEEHCFISMSTAIQYQYRFPSLNNNAYLARPWDQERRLEHMMAGTLRASCDTGNDWTGDAK